MHVRAIPRRCRLACCCAVLATAPAPARADGPGPVGVRVLSVDESRHVEVGRSGERSVFHATSLKLTLELSGAPIETATCVGALRLDQAVDDQGTTLLDRSSLRQSDQAGVRKIDRNQMWFFADEKPKDKIKVEVELKPAARSAARLKSVTGSVRVGATADVTFSNLTTRVGKPLEDPALSEAKVSITLTKVGDKDISYSMSDPNACVADVSLVNSAGKSITRGRWSLSIGALRTFNLDAEPGAIAAGAKLLVTLMTPASAVTVPIDLKDVPLP